MYPEIPPPAPAKFEPTIPTPLSYYLVVEPMEPPTHSAGGIALPAKTKLANRLSTTLGRVRAVGPLCFKMRKDGMDFGDEKNWPGVGDWCIYRFHAGQKLRLRMDQNTLIAEDSEDQRYLLLLTDTDIIGRVKEQDLDKYYAWA